MFMEDYGSKGISFKNWLVQTWSTFQEERSTEDVFFVSATKEIFAYFSSQLDTVRNRDPLETS